MDTDDLAAVPGPWDRRRNDALRSGPRTGEVGRDRVARGAPRTSRPARPLTRPLLVEEGPGSAIGPSQNHRQQFWHADCHDLGRAERRDPAPYRAHPDR